MLHPFASPLASGAGLCRAAAIEWRATRRLSVTTGRPVRWVSAINTVSQAPVLEAPVLAPSLLRAGFEARALMAHRWSGSGLPGDHGRTSCQARATGRYAANDGAWNVDFECFLGSSGTKPLHRVPLQCHPKQCADKHLRPPTARSDIVAYLPVNLRPLVGALVSAVPALRLDYPKTSQPRRR